MTSLNRVVIGDCRDTLATLPAALFQCCVTSPPYWRLRDYGHPSQIGMEETPDEYVNTLVSVFGLVRRTLRDDGTLWLIIGDSYAGAPGGAQGKNSAFLSRTAAKAGAREQQESNVTGGLKPKDLCGIPWRLALALQADGWWLRSDIIWAKDAPTPESVKDRPTRAHEYVFLLAKSKKYVFHADAIREPAKRGATRNARTVWTLPPQPYDGAHFAAMPPRLAVKCILAGSKIGSAVLDPFMGSGTVGLVAESLGREWFGCELNEEYENLIQKRTAQTGLRFAEEEDTCR